MAVVESPERAFGPNDFIWLGIIQPRDGQRHCGFIYSIREEKRLLHLAFHHDLRDENYQQNYWWAPVGLDADNQAVLAALVSTIANGDSRVPYGFDLGEIGFDESTGAVLNAPPGTGLTCATFLLAIFRTYGFLPLSVQSWPERGEDLAWQASILELMETHGVPAEHVDAVRSHPFAARFRPEEVVGCAATNSDQWQIEFTRAQDLAREVLTDLGVAA